ncbi:MAG TPA: glutamate 5-kinase [Fimbriimonadaceae bacterium]|nr:glutamate 5-kinase [Fimbriimonadaceae bacterium]
MPTRDQIVQNARRVVVKLGTAVLLGVDGQMEPNRLDSFVASVAELRRQGREVLIVSSGAIGLGFRKLDLPARPKLLPQKQACAAVGQGFLMALYNAALERHGLVGGQVLLTEADFDSRRRYLNLRSTVGELLRMGVVPVINENDTVSTLEIESRKLSHVKVNFGDNDKLSALVASKIDADLLLILTDVEGLYTDNPRANPEAALIPVVEAITPKVVALATGKGPQKGALGRGGMATKIEAARIAGLSGCPTIVASGNVPNVIARVFAGEELGTLFKAQAGLSGREKWIAFATTVRGSLTVNAGARQAIVYRKGSLLPAGLLASSGEYRSGDVVGICDEAGVEFARGIANFPSEVAERICGMKSHDLDEVIGDRNFDEMVSTDNLVLHANAKEPQG